MFRQRSTAENVGKNFENVSDMKDRITDIKQWLHTDRTQLLDLQFAANTFIEVVHKKFDLLRHHHHIAKSESAFLKQSL